MRKQHSKKNYRLFFAIFFGILCLIIGHGAVSRAQNKSPINLTGNEKIKISADNLTVDNEAKFAEFSGNVKAQQGTNNIRSDKLRIYYKGDLGEKNKKEAPGEEKKEATGQDVVEKAVASGNVKISFDDKVAVSDEAVYINGKQMLILSGPNTKFISGNNSIAGERITIHIETGQVNIEGTKKNRVEAVFYPGDKGGIQ